MTQLKIVNGVKCDLFTKTTKIIAILMFLTGCSAEYHLKKAIKKNPSLIQPSTHTIDTLIVTDSVAITDTFVSKTIDTLTIEKDGVKTIVYRNHDVIRIKTIVRPDTIRIQKTITIPQVQYKERVSIPQWIGVVLGTILLIGLLFAIKRWATGITPTTQTTPKTDGKPHHGVHHKAEEHGRVCARRKTPIQKSVAMVHYGRKALGQWHDHHNLQP